MTSKAYDGQWRRLRARFLKAHPDCIICGETATEVDHVQSVRSHPHLRLVWDNLRSMCKRHHSMRTQRDEGSARHKKSATGYDGMPLDPDHHWNQKG